MDAFQLPQAFRTEETGTHRATIMVEPLFPGYGLTIGNAIRRVLLSSLPGTAATSVRMPRVDHEFSPVAGVKEDAVQIILNLKQLRVKMHVAGPVTLKLIAKGMGPVTADMFEPNADVEIVNKDLILAHTTKKDSGFEMDVTVEQGRGYVPVEQRQGEDLGVGVIAIDAMYSPVRKVGYALENVRVGQRTDYDKLKLDIETDGSVTPEEAFRQATQLLMDHFSAVLGFGTPAAEVAEMEAPSVKMVAKDTLVSSLGLSARTEKVLTRAGMATVGQLSELSDDDMLAIDGLGASALKEVREALAKLSA